MSEIDEIVAARGGRISELGQESSCWLLGERPQTGAVEHRLAAPETASILAKDAPAARGARELSVAGRAEAPSRARQLTIPLTPRPM